MEGDTLGSHTNDQLILISDKLGSFFVEIFMQFYCNYDNEI